MKLALRKSCAGAYIFALTLLASLSAGAQVKEPSAHHGFHNLEHWVQVFESPERARWQRPDEVVKALKLKPGETVIDIGAGTGYFARRFAAAVGPAMVAYMNADANKLKLANYQARVSKPDDPELAPHSADLVFFCDVMHHIDDRSAYLEKLKPALKPGARVAVIDFKKRSLPIGPPPADKISRKEMISVFRAAGYRLIREHRFLPYQYFLEFEPAPAL
jgi:arsenite methyltransferase